MSDVISPTLPDEKYYVEVERRKLTRAPCLPCLAWVGGSINSVQIGQLKRSALSNARSASETTKGAGDAIAFQ